MSARNTLANKAKRRAERTDHAERLAKKRMLQARMNYLAMAPPKTFEELEAKVAELTEEANGLASVELVADGDELVPKETNE